LSKVKRRFFGGWLWHRWSSSIFPQAFTSLWSGSRRPDGARSLSFQLRYENRH